MSLPTVSQTNETLNTTVLWLTTVLLATNIRAMTSLTTTYVVPTARPVVEQQVLCYCCHTVLSPLLSCNATLGYHGCHTVPLLSHCAELQHVHYSTAPLVCGWADHYCATVRDCASDGDDNTKDVVGDAGYTGILGCDYRRRR